MAGISEPEGTVSIFYYLTWLTVNFDFNFTFLQSIKELERKIFVETEGGKKLNIQFWFGFLAILTILFTLLFGVWNALIAICALGSLWCAIMTTIAKGTSNWVSWLQWTLLSAFVVYNAHKLEGVIPTMPLAYGASSAMLTILSLKYKPKWGWGETVGCICFLITVLAYQNIPAYGLHINLFAFMVAAIPIVYDAWKDPHSEKTHLGFWTWQMFGGLFQWISAAEPGPQGTWIGIQTLFFNFAVIVMVRARRAYIDQYAVAS